MRIARGLSISLLTAAVSFAIAGARAEEPLKLRVSWVSIPYGLSAVLFEKPELMQHLGKSYVYEPLHFNSSAAMIAATAASELDIAEFAAFTVGVAIENAKLDDIRVISDEYQDGVAGYFSNGFVVLKDGPIKTVADLRGKVVASLGIGSSADIPIRFMLRKAGLEDKRDYAVLEVAPQNMMAVLDSGKAALVSTVGVAGHDPRVIERTRVLFNRRDVYGGPTQETVFIARAPFIAQHRAAIVDYLEDYLRGLRWFSDSANHREAVDRIARFTKSNPELLEWMFTKEDEYRAPDGRPDLASLQRTLDLAKDFAALRTGIDVNKYEDLSLVTEAAARLKN
jgi:sulfonate transport system substrate-binding protein